MVTANNIPLFVLSLKQQEEIESYKNHLHKCHAKFGCDLQVCTVTPIKVTPYRVEVFVVVYVDSPTKPGVYELRSWDYTLYPCDF